MHLVVHMKSARNSCRMSEKRVLEKSSNAAYFLSSARLDNHCMKWICFTKLKKLADTTPLYLTLERCRGGGRGFLKWCYYRAIKSTVSKWVRFIHIALFKINVYNKVHRWRRSNWMDGSKYLYITFLFPTDSERWLLKGYFIWRQMSSNP